jgi:uncharacterized protein (DUF4213/DUF364 family)
MMSILDELLNSLKQDAPVRSVLVGAHWTMVCSRFCGLASTLVPKQPHGQDGVRDVGRLLEKSACELAEYARSDNLLEASLGVAAINSLLTFDETEAVEINAFDVIVEHGKGKNVALVGHFPFIPKLRPAVGQLWVIEQHPTDGEHPAEAALDFIPKADLVAITGSALINHTLDGLLSLCHPEAMVLILGPSTPLSPVMFEHGATFLSGSRVIDQEAAMITISQGATFQQVKGVRLFTITNGMKS